MLLFNIDSKQWQGNAVTMTAQSEKQSLSCRLRCGDDLVCPRATRSLKNSKQSVKHGNPEEVLPVTEETPATSTRTPDSGVDAARSPQQTSSADTTSASTKGGQQAASTTLEAPVATGCGGESNTQEDAPPPKEKHRSLQLPRLFGAKLNT